MPWARPSGLVWLIRSKPCLSAMASRNAIISANFQVVFTCSSGNGILLGKKALRARPLETGRNLAQDLDALGFQRLQMAQRTALHRDHTPILAPRRGTQQALLVGWTAPAIKAENAGNAGLSAPQVQSSQPGKSHEMTGCIRRRSAQKNARHLAAGEKLFRGDGGEHIVAWIEIDLARAPLCIEAYMA